MAERGGDEPADGCRVRVPCRARAAPRRRQQPCRPAGERARPAASSAHGIAGLELVSDVADELREHVLEGQQSGGPAELVDDQRLMRAPLAQMAQHAVGGDALVNAGDRPHHGGQRGRRCRRPRASARDPWCARRRRCCRAIRGKRAVVRTGSARRRPIASFERRVRCRAPQSACAAPSAAWPVAGSVAARAAAAGARRARAARRRGSRQSAARSLPANECADAPAAVRRSGGAAAGRSRSAT